MAKKIVKKRKLKIFRLLLLILVPLGLFFGGYFYLKLPIVNLIVKDTEYLNDDYVLELAKLRDYPSFWLTNMTKAEKRLKGSPYISDVKIKRSFYHVVTIEVTENKALYFRESDGKIVFLDGEEVVDDESINFRVPRLLNYIPDAKYDSFIKGMDNVSEDIMEKISDIEYVPNELDKERFLLYMDDGNMVYLTLTKFDMINYYNDVLEQLEDKHGILYLDNGNHFQIKE